MTQPGASRTGCVRCRRSVEGEYYQMASQVLCADCAKAVDGGPGGGVDFVRALAYGTGAAFVGTLIWIVVMKLLDSELGIIAIGVGLMVGVAVRIGGRWRGGWKYQALAIGLTYVSITSSYVPFVIKGLAESHHKQEVEKAPDSLQDSVQAQPEPRPPAGAGSVAWFVLIVFGLALAAPFLAGLENLMGIVIIGIALYEAWKINRRLPISGPFAVGAAQLVGSTGPPNAVAPNG